MKKTTKKIGKVTKKEGRKFPIKVKNTNFIMDKEIEETADGVGKVLSSLGDMPIFVITCYDDGDYDLTDIDFVPGSKEEAMKMFNEIGIEIGKTNINRGVKGLILAANVRFNGPYPNSIKTTLLADAEKKAAKYKDGLLIVARDVNGREKSLLKPYEFYGEKLVWTNIKGVDSHPSATEGSNSFKLLYEVWSGFKFATMLGDCDKKLLTGKTNEENNT